MRGLCSNLPTDDDQFALRFEMGIWQTTPNRIVSNWSNEGKLIVSYVAKGVQIMVWPWRADLAVGEPFVVLCVWWLMRRLPQRLGLHLD